MRAFDSQWMLDKVLDNFMDYIYPLVEKIMVGEVRSVSVNVYTKGTFDREQYAHTKLKNREVISVYRIDIWMEDIMRLCRNNKIYLITKEIFDLVSIFYMLHPLYCAKILENPSPKDNYDSVYCGAADLTCQYITRRMVHITKEQHLASDILKYNIMVLTNHSFDMSPNESPLEYKLKSIQRYREYMLHVHKEAYREAVRFKAYTCEVDDNGFIKLEKANNEVHAPRIIEREVGFGDSLGIAINPPKL